MEPPFYNSIDPYLDRREYTMNIKRWYHSRMLWVNLLAVIGSIIAGICTKNWLDGETQVMILAVVDFILRLRTNQGLSK